MEFNEKLQELRKKKGLTQEELAQCLFVSRTAISKWEMGRGFPSIESLKLIARFFSVTVDELLSSDEVLSLAEESSKEREIRLRNLIYGLLDICMALLLFMPLFASRAGGAIEAVPLLSLASVQLYLKVLFFVPVIGMTVYGILMLSLQGCGARLWIKWKDKISLLLSICAVFYFHRRLAAVCGNICICLTYH